MNSKYTFGVIVANQSQWRNWVSEKAGFATKGNYTISTNKFSLRNIEYVKIYSCDDLRGRRLHATIDLTEFGCRNADYDKIQNRLKYCFP